RGAYAILPVNLDLEGSLLRSATVQPLTILRRPDAVHLVFFSIEGLPPELVFESANISQANGCTVSRENKAVVVRGQPNASFSFVADGKPVLLIPQAWAPQALVVSGQRLPFTSAVALPEGSNISLLVAGENSVGLSLYP